MGKNYLTIEKISAYNVALELSNEFWELVVKWYYFAKDTVGKQFVKAVDSILANISEGIGGYRKKDKFGFTE